MLFISVLRDVTDPRQLNARHDLVELLFVAVAAILCGAKSCAEMSQCGESRLDLLRELMRSPCSGGGGIG
jgi:hypothetical protein